MITITAIITIAITITAAMISIFATITIIVFIAFNAILAIVAIIVRAHCRRSLLARDIRHKFGARGSYTTECDGGWG